MSDESNIIKKEIVINASIEKVFSALVDSEQLTQWFLDMAIFEPKVGGRVSFRFLKKKDKDHEVIDKVVSFIPNKELSYTWNFTTKPEYRKDTIVTWKSEQIGNDKTKLTLIHSGFTKDDELQYDDHSKGWAWHLKKLDNFITTSQ